jgi:hypothetical protein
MKIFGREPALVLGFISAILMALADKVPYLNVGQAVALIALLTMGLAAFMTRPWKPAAFTAVLIALFAVLAEYGWNFEGRTIEAIAAVLVSGLALLGIRDQATPLADPNTVWLQKQTDGVYR